MEIRLKGTDRMLSEDALSNAFLGKRNEETALRHEAIRARQRAIKRAKSQLLTAALLGETRLYLESE
jgi:hypothetical protein